MSIRNRVFASVLAVAAVMALWLTLTGTTPVQAKATTVTTNSNIPISLVVFVPCAQGGTGEIVKLSGDLHALFHVTIDNAGGFHFQSHFNPKGVSGLGLASGDKYRATGVTRFGFNAHGLPFEFTSINNFRIIGQGAGNNLLIHMNLHLTVNANGDVTANVGNVRIDCK